MVTAHHIPVRRNGYSLVEAMVAVTITSIAGGALLASLGGAVRSSSDAVHAVVARGIAEQLMEEIAATRFPASTNTTPAGATRANFDDIDDYHGWTKSPPEDRYGHVLGAEGHLLNGTLVERPDELQPDPELVSCFTHAVTVERVTPDTGTGWNVVTTHTNYRRVTVTVSYTDSQSHTQTLAVLTRVFSYVPIAP
jgi:type II secretory pathway pseudopilin PulG